MLKKGRILVFTATLLSSVFNVLIPNSYQVPKDHGTWPDYTIGRN